jgi:hypothetical protein
MLDQVNSSGTVITVAVRYPASRIKTDVGHSLNRRTECLANEPSLQPERYWGAERLPALEVALSKIGKLPTVLRLAGLLLDLLLDLLTLWALGEVLDALEDRCHGPIPSECQSAVPVASTAHPGGPTGIILRG